MTYLINFPVGDWSDDGHGKCDHFEVESNKSAQELREIHFSAIDKLGFDIGDICGSYEASELSIDIFDKLVAAGFDIQWQGENQDMEKYFYDNDSRGMGSEEVFNLWIDILKFIDKDLEIKVKASESVDISFYGFDRKKRHLKTPGYGTFI